MSGFVSNSNYLQMSAQKYKRTNFDDDDNSPGVTPTGVTYDPAIAFKEEQTSKNTPKAGASFWQKRTVLEKVLLFVLGASLVLLLVLIALLAAKSPAISSSAPASNVCVTKACVTLASNILNSMDPTVDPCTDFYSYACGGWIKNNPIPDGKSRWGTFARLWKQNQLILKDVLGYLDGDVFVERETSITQTVAEQKAKDYYTSCMDGNKTVEKLKDEPLHTLLREIGGWGVSPRTGAFNIAEWNFQDALGNVHALGNSVLFTVWVGEDDKDVTKNILQIDQSGLMLPREDYLNKTIREDKELSAYLDYMTKIGVALGGEHNATEKAMYDVIEFETKLAEVFIPNSERRDDMKNYHKMRINDLKKLMPMVDWYNLLTKLFATSEYQVSQNEEILVVAPKYLKSISSIIEEMLKTDEGKTMTSYLTQDFRKIKREFNEKLSGATGREEEWRYCVTDTHTTLGFAVGAMFINETFHSDSRDRAEEMVGSIKSAFKSNLYKLTWMDKKTKALAKDKADAVFDMIGYPDFILNGTALDERYEQFEVNADEYFLNNVRDMKYQRKRNCDKMAKPPDRMAWSMSPQTINAYYSPTKNEIVFPAGVLQAPFFDKEYPSYINYGGMGVVMGHELVHGFDDKGREYDKNGNLRFWWNNATVEKFEKKAQCYVDQYGKFSLNGVHLRGKNTLGENIADNGGLKSSYTAYNRFVSQHGEDPLLPGVNLTQKQLFFTAFSQIWCSHSRPQAERLSLLTNPHSPPRFRVLGTLTNSPDFATSFNCPAGAHMNPSSPKCSLW